MLTFNATEEKNTCFKFIGANSQPTQTRLISDNVCLISSNIFAEGGDDSCSFYSGPSDATIMAFGESYESAGTIAYEGGSESCGSIAYSGGSESCGSIASSFSSSSSSFSGGCSYCC